MGRVGGSWSRGDPKGIVSLLALLQVSQETLRASESRISMFWLNLSALTSAGTRPQRTRAEAGRPVSNYLGEEWGPQEITGEVGEETDSGYILSAEPTGTTKDWMWQVKEKEALGGPQGIGLSNWKESNHLFFCSYPAVNKRIKALALQTVQPSEGGNSLKK